MYDYHYTVMKAHYGDNIKLMYTDTGKYIKTYLIFIYYINFYFRFLDIPY